MSRRRPGVFRSVVRLLLVPFVAACAGLTFLVSVGWFLRQFLWPGGGLPDWIFVSGIVGLVLGVFVVIAVGYATDRLFRFLWPKPPADDHE